MVRPEGSGGVHSSNVCDVHTRDVVAVINMSLHHNVPHITPEQHASHIWQDKGIASNGASVYEGSTCPRATGRGALGRSAGFLAGERDVIAQIHVMEGV
jgi:hypothetical protein